MIEKHNNTIVPYLSMNVSIINLEYYTSCLTNSDPNDRVKWAIFTFAHLLKNMIKNPSNWINKMDIIYQTCNRLIKEIEIERPFIDSWVESSEKILFDLLVSTIEIIKRNRENRQNEIYSEVTTKNRYEGRLRKIKRVNYKNM